MNEEEEIDILNEMEKFERELRQNNQIPQNQNVEEDFFKECEDFCKQQNIVKNECPWQRDLGNCLKHSQCEYGHIQMIKPVVKPPSQSNLKSTAQEFVPKGKVNTQIKTSIVQERKTAPPQKQEYVQNQVQAQNLCYCCQGDIYNCHNLGEICFDLGFCFCAVDDF